MKKMSLVGGLLALIVLLLSISCEKMGDPVTVSQFQVNKNVTMSSESQGLLNRRTFYNFETIFLTFADLYAEEQVDIQIIRVSDLKMIKRLLVFSDGYGAIRNLPIWYHIGYHGPCSFEDMSEKYVVHLLQPGVDRPWVIYSIPFEIHKGIPPTPQIRVVDAGGCFIPGSLHPGEQLLIEGSRLPQNQNVQLLVVANRISYVPGDVLTDLSDNGIETVSIGANGTLAPTVIWNSVAAGPYDLIVDTEPFGIYNAGDVVNDALLTGLVVQNAPIYGDIIQDIACDQFGNYKMYFDSLETVYAKVNAFTKPRLASEYVSIFLTTHKPVWQAGDSLVALCTVGTFEMPINCLWNGTAGSLPLISTHGQSAPDDPTPVKLWPGLYDVIIDVDRDYVYTPGIDILDGGPVPGFIVAGNPPPVRFGASADIDFLGLKDDNHNMWGVFRDVTHTPVWGVLVDSLGNFVRNNKIKFEIVSGPGFFNRDSSFTNYDGAGFSIFAGGRWGQGTLVKLSTVVNGITYVKYVRIFRKIPYSHNQGIVIGG